jgi:hypothetical protein
VLGRTPPDAFERAIARRAGALRVDGLSAPPDAFERAVARRAGDAYRKETR